MTRVRTGCLYGEYTSAGRAVRGVGYVRKFRWVAEMTVGGRRYRCRSSSWHSCRAWLDDMVERYSDIGVESGHGGQQQTQNAVPAATAARPMKIERMVAKNNSLLKDTDGMLAGLCAETKGMFDRDDPDIRYFTETWAEARDGELRYYTDLVREDTARRDSRSVLSLAYGRETCRARSAEALAGAFGNYARDRKSEIAEKRARMIRIQEMNK